MNSQFSIGCCQITWSKVPEQQVLSEIALAGYEGAPAGPRSDRSAGDTIALYARYGLRPAPGYFMADFWKPEKTSEILEKIAAVARCTRELGCTELYVAAGGFDYVPRCGQTRRQLAGHVGPEDGLTDDQFKRFAEVLTQAGRVTLKEGVRSCFHNHVGTPIETEGEFSRLMDLSDPEAVFLGPDTGHLAWGGGDVVAFFRRYAPRIRTVHLKDVHAPVMQRGRAEKWDYSTFTQNGLFAELGEGCIDFPALFPILRNAGFQGWLIAETDVTRKPTAFESAQVSRRYLKSLGL